MKVSRHLRMSFLAVMALCVVVALSSCSKKDILQDEPGFGTEEAGMAVGEGEEMGTETSGEDFGAGAAGTGDLQIAYFAYDSYALDSSAREALKMNSDWLSNNAAATVQVEGHCDERGTTEYNIALGERRANATMDYLVRMGIDQSRLSVISYGEERPSDPGHDETAWGKNRRSEFIILSQ